MQSFAQGHLPRSPRFTISLGSICVMITATIHTCFRYLLLVVATTATLRASVNGNRRQVFSASLLTHIQKSSTHSIKKALRLFPQFQLCHLSAGSNSFVSLPIDRRESGSFVRAHFGLLCRSQLDQRREFPITCRRLTVSQDLRRPSNRPIRCLFLMSNWLMVGLL